MSVRPLLGALAGLCLSWMWFDTARSQDLVAGSAPQSTETAARPSSGVPPIPGFGGSFRLIDHSGHGRSDADFRGKLMLVSFGFTQCPDVCPVQLLAIAEALDRLGPLASEVTPVFITVDPAHDTPAEMQAFVGQFHPAIVGLTGKPREIADVIRKYRAHVMLAASGDPTQTSHSSFMYLMGRDGGFISLILPGAEPEEIAARIAKYAR